MVLIGEDGEVSTDVGGKSTKASLKPAPVMIRNAREIGGFVFACVDDGGGGPVVDRSR